MSHIRSKTTKQVITVRKWLWAHGYRYRLNVKSVPGKPDIVMRKYRTAIFVNGKQTTIKPPSSSNGKTIPQKRSSHFLETRMFIYRYNNARPEDSRRLPLLFQFLTKEQRTFPTPYTVHPTSYTERFQNTTTRFGCCVPVGMIYTPAGRRTSLVEVRY